MSQTRYAAIRGASRDTLRAYLPSNYKVLNEQPLMLNNSPYFVITGTDEAGWTLDGYVLPRLASGLHFGREIDEHHELMRLHAESTTSPMTGLRALRQASEVLREIDVGTVDTDLIAGKLDQIANLIESSEVRQLVVLEGRSYDLATEAGFETKAQAERARVLLADFARKLANI